VQPECATTTAREQARTRRWLAIGGVALLAVVLIGCGRAIPSGAQQVHVVVTDGELRLDPAAVHAGDVYLVLDIPGSIGGFFIQRARSADETSGPLSDDDLARLTRGGDGQGFSIGILDDPRCPEDRGQMGPPCGNVYRVVLIPGKYAFVLGMIEMGPPRSMAVLEVLP
jgi:hypothetical protein